MFYSRSVLHLISMYYTLACDFTKSVKFSYSIYFQFRDDNNPLSFVGFNLFDVSVRPSLVSSRNYKK